jgi:hypothetical protein
MSFRAKPPTVVNSTIRKGKNRSDSVGGSGHGGHGLQSSTQLPQNQAASFESQTIHPIQYAEDT